MKKIQILLLFISIYGFGQESFEYIHQDSAITRGFSTFEDNNGYLITIGVRFNSTSNGFILKHKGPEDMTSYIFSKQDTALFFRFGYQKANGNYVFIGDYSPTAQSKIFLYTLETTDGLEIVTDHSYEIPEIYNYVNLSNFIIDSDSCIVIDGFLEDPDPGFIQNLFVIKLTSEGTVHSTCINTTYKGDWGTELIQKIDNSGYYLIGDLFITEAIEFDNNLNIVDTFFNDDCILNGYLSSKRLANGKVVLGGMANQEYPGAYYDLRMRVVDISTLTPYLDTVIFDAGKNRLPDLSGLDFISEDKIWVVTYPKETKNSEWEKNRIYIFNSDLEVVGAKYFTSENNIDLSSVVATTDGGFIITGWSYFDGGSLYIKKVMEDDILTSAEETLSTDDKDIFIFPNPFDNVMKIETYRKGLFISLFNNKGSVLIEKHKLSIPYTSISTNNFPSGAYFYSIFDKEKIIQNGKLIKNK